MQNFTPFVWKSRGTTYNLAKSLPKNENVAQNITFTVTSKTLLFCSQLISVKISNLGEIKAHGLYCQFKNDKILWMILQTYTWPTSQKWNFKRILKDGRNLYFFTVFKRNNKDYVTQPKKFLPWHST